MYFRKEPVGDRLGALADSGRTGALRVPGALGGAIYLRDGEVVFAESRRTPGPAAAGSPEGQGPPALRALAREAALREATFDALTELVPRSLRRARFRPDETPRTAGEAMPLGMVRAEIARRQALLGQLSPLLTMDSPVERVPGAGPLGPQASAFQRAVLTRAGAGATARSAAMDLGQSVFATTLEVFRLVAMGLLTAGPQDRSPGRLDGRRPAISFLRAVIGQRCALSERI